MSEDVFQLKRGTTAQVAAYLPSIGEPVYNVTLKKFSIGDGVTLGGVDPAASKAESGANTDITSITGSAASLTTTRSISLTGDGAWTVNFNGTADATGALTLSSTGVGAGTYGSVTVNAKGLVTAGSTITPVANGGTGLSALGTGMATFWETPSSANLAAAVTDETGTGALVFANTPTLVTPNLGEASATSLKRGTSVQTTSFTVAANENWIVCNGAGTITVTLPAPASFVGRELMIKTIAAQTVVSASSNVAPLIGGAVGTAILSAAAGKYATLVSNGTNWVIMQAN